MDSLGTRSHTMRCTSPRQVENQRLPCGQCRACKEHRIKEWALRLGHEMSAHRCAVFVTLTYTDDTIPEHGGLEKKDLQDFWKRLRHHYDQKLVYYTCGEYGGIGGRPHYHALIFGLEWCTKCRCCSKDARRRNIPPAKGTDCQRLEDSWALGYTHIGDIGPGAIKYVVGYLKKSDETNIGGRERPFALMSKGIGLRWMQEHQEKLTQELVIRNGRHRAGIPAYYKKKLADQYGEMKDQGRWIMGQILQRYALEKERQQRDELAHKHGLTAAGAALVDQRRQHERNLAAKTARKMQGETL